MSLILAIEPDRRQVAQLINIVRQRVGAELVLADTTERALESIGGRIPDLILVPALLSPQDDAALAAALRVIASAAHVQMLTIPTFASAKPHPKSRGVLSAFRRSSKETLDGCDPGVFAEQVSSYLERAAEERAAAQAFDDDAEALAADRVLAAAPADDLSAAVPADDLPPGFQDVEAPDIYTEQWTAAADPPPAPALDEIAPVAAPVETVQTVDTIDIGLSAVPPVPDDVLPVILADPLPTAMALDEFVATLERTEPVVEDLHAEPAMAMAPVPALALTEDEAEAELFAAFDLTELPVIEEVHTEQWMASATADERETDQDEADQIEADQLDIDLSTELEAVLHAEEPAERAEPEAALKPFEAVVPVERFEPFPLAAWQSWPPLEGTAAEAYQASRSDNAEWADTSPVAEFEAAVQAAEPLERFEPVVPVRTFEPLPLAAWQSWPRLEGVVAEAYEEPIAPRAAVARPEWVELMRSLREDIARRRTELAQPVQAAPLPLKSRQRPAEKAAAQAPPAPLAVKRVKRTRPIEDEWGLFDPEQCGFAALLDKLDEITGPPGTGPTRRQA